MKLLVIGSGGREHALAWRLAKSPGLQKVYVAPGNAGTEHEAEMVNVPLTDPAALARLGVKTAAVTTTVASQMTDGFARGLDVGPLAAIVAEADAARAAAAASQAEASRLEALYRQDVSASRRSVVWRRSIRSPRPASGSPRRSSPVRARCG